MFSNISLQKTQAIVANYMLFLSLMAIRIRLTRIYYEIEKIESRTIDKIRRDFCQAKDRKKQLTPEEALRKCSNKTDFDKQADNGLDSC